MSMNVTSRIRTLIEERLLSFDPIWPWSVPGVGWPALAGVAVLLIVSAVYNYLRVPSANLRRIQCFCSSRPTIKFIASALLTGSYMVGSNCPSMLLSDAGTTSMLHPPFLSPIPLPTVSTSHQDQTRLYQPSIDSRSP